jgi:OmpA-OmpF porin, OOP family
MARLAIFGAFGLFLPAAVLAQSTVLEDKSADDIACELAGDCASFDAAADAADASDDGTAATRGWTLGTRARPAASVAVTRPQVRPVGMTTTTSSQGRVVARKKVAAPRVPGKTTLGITFERGSAALDGTSLAQADRLYEALRSPALSKFRYVVSGHSDSVGSRALNLELSRRRAQAVVDYLAQKGLVRDQFTVRGFADDRPLGGLSPSSSANRRVEVVKVN